MGRIAGCAVLAGLLSLPCAYSTELKCEAGPSHKRFGGAVWLVYGCSDGKSVIVTADKDNPAAPFYFVLSPQGRAVAVQGEGYGSKAASDAAAAQLRAMSAADLRALVVETHGH